MRQLHTRLESPAKGARANSKATGITIRWEAFIWLAVSGVVFGLLQGIGRALWVPIAVHNLSNAIGYIGLFG